MPNAAKRLKSSAPEKKSRAVAPKRPSAAAEKLAKAPKLAPKVFPAVVTEVGAPGVVRVAERAGAQGFDARLAVAFAYAPRVGDRVLIARGAGEERYVIGVLGALREVPSPLVAPDGTSVTLEGEGGGEVLRLRDGEGRLLLEHRTADRKTVVYAPAGDLEFRADEGAIDLVARDAVRLRSDGGIELSGRDSVKLATPPLADRPGSSVGLDARGVCVATPLLETHAERADASIGEARLVARTLNTAVETARHVVGVLETRANRVLERAKNVYRDVEELSQTRAGRMRLVADATFHILGKRTLLKAEEDMKLKGEKIHLG